MSACNNLVEGAAGLTDGSVPGDWHLANVKEYQSLIHYGVINFAVPDTLGTGQWSEGDPFNNVQSSSYWSSTTLANNSATAWSVLFVNGNLNFISKGFNLFVWCVRGG